MLKIFNQNHESVGTLIHYKNLKIESDVTTGDKTLSFSLVGSMFDILNEYYVQTSQDEFVVKKISENNYECILNVEELEGTPFQEFSVVNSSIQSAISQAITGTGWTLDHCDIGSDVLKNAGMINVNAFSVIANLCTVWMCEVVYDSLHKKVNIYKQYGEDKGCYVASGLNLRKLKKSGDSYDFYTMIIPIGYDGMTIESVNNNRNYLENYTYSTKKKCYLWIDETYTDPQILKDDAELYLDELAHPIITYDVDAIDLSKQSSKYSVLSFKVGDMLTVIDFKTKTRTKQRIIKTVEYPQTPWKNSVELTNKVIRFTEMLSKVNNANNISTYEVTNGTYSGTVSLSKILNELRNK